MNKDTAEKIAAGVQSILGDPENKQIKSVLTDGANGFCYIGAYFESLGIPKQKFEYGVGYDIDVGYMEHLKSIHPDITRDEIRCITYLNDNDESYEEISQRLLNGELCTDD